MSKYRGIVLEPEVSRDVEPSATILYDMSRYGTNGTFKAAGEPAWVQLPSGLWVNDYDGNDYIVAGAASADSPLNFTYQDFSILAWVYTTNLAAHNTIFCRFEDLTEGYWFFILNTGTLYFRTSQGAANQNTIGTSGELVINTWYLVGMSRIGADVYLYQNSVPTRSTIGVHIDPASCARTAKIGIRDNLITNPFIGRMSPPRVYNYALSAGQVLQRFEATRSLFGV